MRSKDTHIPKHFATLMIQTRKDFFIQVLDQFATNGNELLQILDDIESGECECFLEDWALILYTFPKHFSSFSHDSSNCNLHASECSQRRRNAWGSW